jgi:ABC-type multidrug transport system fused ATPase/permease subunit
MEADEILVMDNGQICGFGSHEELLLSCPLYKEIYDVQMSREVS